MNQTMHQSPSRTPTTLQAVDSGCGVGANGASPETPPADAEAARFVEQARAFAGRVTPDALLRAIDLLERAIARDPGYRPAWTGLAGTLMVASMTGVVPPERRAGARAIAEQASRIDSRSGAPCAIVAVLDAGDCRWLEADAGLRAARERSPDDPMVQEAEFLFRVSIGHIDRATQLAEAVAHAAPALPNIALSRAHVALIAGDMATVAGQVETAALLGSAEDRATMRVLRAELALARGDAEAAAIPIAALFGSTVAMPASGMDGAAAAVGAAIVGAGDAGAASAMIMRFVDIANAAGALERNQILFGQLINWQVRIGTLDAAFVLAERLIDARERSGFVAARAIHQWWRADMREFREDGRFAGLTERLKLPVAWRQLGWPDSYSDGAASSRPQISL